LTIYFSPPWERLSAFSGEFSIVYIGDFNIVFYNNLINGLGPYFEHIEKHVDVRINELKNTLEDQQRVIDTLSVRSVKQESEIKDFKRILKNQ